MSEFTIYQSEYAVRAENVKLRDENDRLRDEVNRLRAVVGEAPIAVRAAASAEAQGEQSFKVGNCSVKIGAGQPGTQQPRAGGAPVSAPVTAAPVVVGESFTTGDSKVTIGKLASPPVMNPAIARARKIPQAIPQAPVAAPIAAPAQSVNGNVDNDDAAERFSLMELG